MESVLSVEVVGREVLGEAVAEVPVGSIVVKLQLKLAVPREGTGHAPQRVAAARDDVRVSVGIGPALVVIALDRERIAAVTAPIHPESALSQSPGVAGIGAVTREGGAAAESGPVHPVGRPRAESAAVAQRAEGVQLGAAATLDRQPLRLGGALGDDVDHAVHRVGAPQRAAGATDDLDAIHILQGHVLHVPEDAGVERGVDGPTVDQHQQLVGEHVVEAARAHRPLAGIGLRHLEIGRQPQRVDQARGAGPADVVARDDLNGGGGGGQLFRAAGDRGDFDIHQLFETQPLQRPGRRKGVRRLRLGPPRRQRRGQREHRERGVTCDHNRRRESSMGDQSSSRNLKAVVRRVRAQVQLAQNRPHAGSVTRTDLRQVGPYLRQRSLRRLGGNPDDSAGRGHCEKLFATTEAAALSGQTQRQPDVK
jgi:hypothetical protein